MFFLHIPQVNYYNSETMTNQSRGPVELELWVFQKLAGMFDYTTLITSNFRYVVVSKEDVGDIEWNKARMTVLSY